MNIEGTLEAVAGCGLPPELKSYLGRFIRMEADSSLRRALKADPARILKNIEVLLSSASAVLGQPEEEVLSNTDFDYENFDHDRLESALAELRVVNLLDLEGFSKIKVVPKRKDKSADILASLSGEIFAFEVKCVNGDNNLFATDFFTGADGKTSAAGKDAVVSLKNGYLKKIRQARVSRKKEGAGQIGVFIVINPVGFVHLTEVWELVELAGRVYESLGCPAREHVCLVSGAAAAFHPPFR
ncbi:MAG: hypothetical protein RQ748_11630 [Elusimicrobiales bacterium]|nr:hypothetical protein [Elusimicrobiales bacterium]